jgi:ABC-type antimicrobial peptide transport system permease subunit
MPARDGSPLGMNHLVWRFARRRELALLRAIAASRRQTRWLFARRRELALLRAIAATPRQTRWLLLGARVLGGVGRRHLRC